MPMPHAQIAVGQPVRVTEDHYAVGAGTIPVGTGGTVVDIFGSEVAVEVNTFNGGGYLLPLSKLEVVA